MCVYYLWVHDCDLRAVTGAGGVQCKLLKLALSLLWMLTECMYISQRSHVVWVGPPCPCGPCSQSLSPFTASHWLHVCSTRQEPFRTWDHLVQCQGRLCRSQKLTSTLTGWGSAADLCVLCMGCLYLQYIYPLPYYAATFMYCMAENLGRKILWQIVENMSFGGTYFGGRASLSYNDIHNKMANRALRI